jgi:hypothetical protein
MKKFLFRVFVLSLLFMGAQAASLPRSMFLETIEEDTVLPQGQYILINSPGGSVIRAFQLAEQVKDKTCIVFNAGSAALMIVLPACNERYYVPNAMFEFHNAITVIPPFHPRPIAISQWDAAELALDLANTNERILKHMQDNGVPFSEGWLRKVMKESSPIWGNGLRYWHPWARPIAECIYCPEYLKMMSASQGQSN